MYTITPSAGGCAGTAFTVTVTVNPSTVLNSTTTPTAICSNAVFNYTPTSTTPGTTFNWTRAVVAGISNAAASGTGNPAETLVNTGSTAVSVVYVYTLSTASGCTSSTNVTVVVNPSPILSSTLTPTAVCSGSIFSYTATSATVGATYSWSRAAVVGISNAAAAGTGNVSETLINTTQSAVTVAYVYTTTNPTTGCSSSQTVTLVVNPIPVIANQTLTNCAGTSFTFTPTGVPTGTTYTWGVPVSSPLGVLTGTTGTNQSSITQTLTNATLNPATATYTITPSIGGTCPGASFTLTVTVNPVPVVANQTLAAVCSGTAFSYIPTGVPVGTTYSWLTPVLTPASGLTGGSALTGQSSISQILSSTNNIANTAVYTVTPSSNSCVGASFLLTVPVNPTPIVSAQTATICSGNAFTVTPTPVPTGTTYTWSAPVITPAGAISGAVAQTTGVASIGATLSNTTTTVAQAVYTVTPTVGGCAGVPFTVTVTVNPSTVLNSTTTPTAICSNTVFNYTPTSTTPGTTFNWTRAVVTGISNAAASGTGNPAETLVNTGSTAVSVVYVYTLSTASGCTSSTNVTVVVNPSPILSSTLTPTAVCSGSIFSYTATSATVGATYSWSRAAVVGISNAAAAGTGNVSETLINTTQSAVTVAYVYTTTNPTTGCSSSQTVTLVVNPIPVIANQTLTNCAGTSFTFTPTGVPTGTTYTWGVPVSSPLGVLTGTTGTNQSSITQTLTNATLNPATATYTITPSIGGTCPGASFTLTVTVNPVPVVANQTLAAVCSGTAFSYIPTGVPVGTTYSWLTPVLTPASGLTGGSALTGQSSISQILSSTNNIANTAVYTVTPSSNSCVGASFLLTVPVNPTPIVSAQTATICSGNAFTVTPTPVPTGTTYTWSAPVITPAGAISGAVAQTTGVASIGATLSNTTTTVAQAVYTVTPTVGGCAGVPFTVTVTVNPATVLNSTTTPTAICSNTVFNYTPTSTTPGTTFNWTRAVVTGISNAAASGTGNPAETLVNTGSTAVSVVYVYTLSTASGCTSSTSVTVVVNPSPILSSTLTPTAVCSGSIFSYTATSATVGATYSWSRAAVVGISNAAAAGTGNVSETLINTTQSAVTVAYVYTTTNPTTGCSSSQTVTLVVNPIPVIANQTLTNCAGTSFTFTPTGVPTGTTYTWGVPVSSPLGVLTGTTGTNQSSITQTLTNATLNPATATYTITPSIGGTCPGASFTLTVTVNPVPVVANQTLAAVCSGTAFSYIPTGVPVGTTYSWLTPVLTPASGLTGGSALTGQSSISQILSSTNNIANTAVYTVTPSSNSCVGASFLLTVPVNPTPIVSAQTATICSGNAFTVTPTPVPTGTTYTWSAPVITPAGAISGAVAQTTGVASIGATLSNTTTTVAQAVYTVTPTVGGCAGVPFTVTVTVNPSTVLNSTTTPTAICSNTVFNYTPTSTTPGTTFNWTRAVVTGISNAAASGTGNPAETLVNTGSTAVSVVYVYTLSTASGCTSSTNVTVVVNPSPILSSTLTPTAVCSGSIFSYTATSATVGATYSWSRAAVVGISNAAAAGTGNVSETLINTTQSAVTVAYVYTTTNPTTGCSSSQTVTLVVNPIPVIANQTLTNCAGTSFTFTPTGVPTGTTYTWGVPVSSPLGVLTGTTGTNQSSITQTLTNATLNPATATYTITPSIGGTCPGASFTLTVTVNPVPVVANQTLAAVCSGTAFSYIPTGVPVGTTYSWLTPVLTPASGLTGGSALTGQSSISQILSSTNNIANTAVYTVTPSSNSCVGASFLLTVPVNPTPIVSAQTATICSGNAFTVTPTPVPTGTTYTWSAPVITPAGAISGAVAQTTGVASIGATLSNTTTTVAQAVYTVTPTVGGCAGVPFTVTVTVNPATVLNSTTTPTAICSNTVFNYTPTSTTPGTTFNWTRAVVTGISNAAASGTGNPAETLVNTGSTAVSVVYVYTLSTASGCTSSTNVTVVVNPSPILSSTLTPTAVCSGSIFSYTATSATVGATYSWSRAAVVGISNAAAAGTGNPNEVLINTTQTAITVGYVYTLTNPTTGCTNTETVSVVVNPIPIVANQTLTNCAGTSFSFTPTGVPLGTTYTWGAPTSAPLGILTGTTGTAQTSISGTLTNASINPAVATYTIIPSVGGCVGASFTLKVTVNPIPVVADKVLASICSGTAFTYVPTGVPVGTTYAWNNPVISPAFGLIGGSAQTAQNIITQTLTSSNDIVNTAVYTVTPTANSCAGVSFQLTVPVNPVPAISNQTISSCSGNAFSLIPSPVPVGTTYTWGIPVVSPFGALSGGANQVTGVTSFTGTLSNTTNTSAQAVYTVIPNAGGCAGTPFTVTVTVNPATQLSSSLIVPAICSNTLFSYTPTSNTAGTTFQWSRAAVAGIVNPADIGTNSPNEILINNTNLPIVVTYVYTLVTAAGCTNTQSILVTVKPTPILTSLINPPAICSGAVFNYTPVSNMTGTTFTWTRAAQAFINNIAASGTNDPAEKLVNSSINTVSVDYVYTLTASGCSNQQTITVPVNPTPVVPNQITTTCSNTAFNVSPTNVPVGTTYTWSLPTYTPLGSITGGTAQGIPQASISELLTNQTLLPASARYTVIPTAGACVGVAFRVDVTVSAIPTIANQTVTACSGTAFSFKATAVPTGTTYVWTNPVINPAGSLTGGSAQSVAQTSVSQTLISSNNLTNTATYIVTPFANGCAGNDFTLTVNINPTPAIASITDTICSGTTLTVIPSPVPVGTQYTWALPSINPFGSVLGTTNQTIPSNNITQTLINTTNLAAKVDYLITPVAGTCVGAPFNLTVYVGAPLPTVPDQVAEICSGATFNATPLGLPAGTTYTWTLPTVTPAGSLSGMFGTTIAQTTVSQKLDNLILSNAVAVYQVTAKNMGCLSNVFNATITVLPIPKLTVTSSPIICRYPTDTIALSFNGKAPWSFNYTDDNSAIKTVSNITTNPYTLLLPITALNTRSFRFMDMAFAGCLNTKDTVDFVQTINNLPVGVIHSLHGQYLCNNILDTLFITSPDSLRYQWTLNGTNFPGAIFDSLTTGLGGRYNASIINQYGCVDTIAQAYTLIKMSQPILKMTYDTWCINTAVNFRNLTDTSTTGQINWLWRFGDGNTATGYNSSNTYLTRRDAPYSLASRSGQLSSLYHYI